MTFLFSQQLERERMNTRRGCALSISGCGECHLNSPPSMQWGNVTPSGPPPRCGVTLQRGELGSSL